MIPLHLSHQVGQFPGLGNGLLDTAWPGPMDAAEDGQAPYAQQAFGDLGNPKTVSRNSRQGEARPLGAGSGPGVQGGGSAPARGRGESPTSSSFSSLFSELITVTRNGDSRVTHMRNKRPLDQPNALEYSMSYMAVKHPWPPNLCSLARRISEADRSHANPGAYRSVPPAR